MGLYRTEHVRTIFVLAAAFDYFSSKREVEDILIRPWFRSQSSIVTMFWEESIHMCMRLRAVRMEFRKAM